MARAGSAGWSNANAKSNGGSETRQIPRRQPLTITALYRYCTSRTTCYGSRLGWTTVQIRYGTVRICLACFQLMKATPFIAVSLGDNLSSRPILMSQGLITFCNEKVRGHVNNDEPMTMGEPCVLVQTNISSLCFPFSRPDEHEAPENT